MKLDIRGILSKEEGDLEIEKIGSENSEDLEDGLKLNFYKGQVQLINLGESILANFKLTASLNQDCDRCLEPVEHSLELNFSREYSFKGNDDTIPIEGDLTVDIHNPIMEEMYLNIPSKNICIKCVNE